jgi:hypothetical protein
MSPRGDGALAMVACALIRGRGRARNALSAISRPEFLFASSASLACDGVARLCDLLLEFLIQERADHADLMREVLIDALHCQRG